MNSLPTKEIAKMWRIFPISQNNPISLRAISPTGASAKLHTRNITFTAEKYPDIQDRQLAFEETALRLNDQGYNVYLVMNQIAADFPGDEHNELAVSDRDISCRHLLLIDMDRAGSTTEPATDADISEAHRVADEISDYLLRELDTVPVRVMSGNGFHLYLPLDCIPNDDQTKTLCKGLLKRLAARFNTDTTKVDTSVYNASRITKVPGTVARKGNATNERPFRMAMVL